MLLEVDGLTGVIVHGPATKPNRLALIAKRFGLRAWWAELDQHYFTGEDADGLFGPRGEVQFTMTARIRYSLRLVFLGLTIAAVLLTLWSNAAKGQRQTVAEIRSLGGAIAKPHLDLPAFQDLDFRRVVAAGDFSFLDRLGILRSAPRDRSTGRWNMPYFDFLWTDENIEHVAEHGISQADFELVVCHPDSKGFSRSSRLPVAWGYTADGRYVMAVYEELDAITIHPVTAYEVPEPT